MLATYFVPPGASSSGSYGSRNAGDMASRLESFEAWHR